MFDGSEGNFIQVPIYHRSSLEPGSTFDGPAVIVEDETTTVVTSSFNVTVDAFESIILSAKD